MSDKLARREETAIAIPDFDAYGMDQIDATDLEIPQIKVCQPLSPEKQDDKRIYIEGLKDGDIFRTGVGEIIRKEPVEFIVATVDKYGVRKDPITKKFAEKVDFNDPRCQFGPKGEKPTCDRTYEFLVYLPGKRFEGFPFAFLRLNKTKIQAAKQIMNHVKMAGGFSKPVFRLEAIKEQNTSGETFYNYRVTRVGSASPDQYAKAIALRGLYEKGQAKIAADQAIEVEGEVQDDIPF